MNKTIELKVGTYGTSLYHGKDAAKELIEEDVNFFASPLNYLTAEAFAGGNVTLGIPGLMDDPRFTLTFRTLTPQIMKCFTPGLHTFDGRWKDINIMRQSKEQKKVLHKMILEGWPLGLLPQLGPTMNESGEYPVEYTMASIIYYIADQEVLKWSTSGEYKILGVDQNDDLRAGL